MIRHILLFSLRADVSPKEAEMMLDDFSHFPENFPQMQGWQFGLNTSRRDQHFDYAMTVSFADWPSVNAYLDSPEHERFVMERFRPLISRRAIATFEVTTENK